MFKHFCEINILHNNEDNLMQLTFFDLDSVSEIRAEYS